jgi:ABC-type uncharacterized transport system ATPase subunit
VELEPGADADLNELATMIGAEPWATGVEREGGSLRVAVADAAVGRRRLLALLAARELPVAAFERQRPTLEDVFLRLVGRGTTEPER